MAYMSDMGFVCCLIFGISDIISLSDGLIETNARNPVIGVAGSNVYVAWSEDDAIVLSPVLHFPEVNERQ